VLGIERGEWVYIGLARRQGDMAALASVVPPVKLGMAIGLGRCGVAGRSSRTSWLIKARSGHDILVFARF
jgi:hypothetical protein